MSTAVVEAPPVTTTKLLTRGQVIGLLVLILVGSVPALFGNFGYFVGQYALVYAMIGLSVTVLTGYAGLISVMQYSFAGVGAVITGLAMASWGWPFWIALPLAAVATIPVSLVVGMVSVRLKRLYLAIATLTFANVLGETFFKWERVTGGGAGWIIEKPTLGPLDFTSDVAFYVLCFVVAVVMVWMIEGLRTSRMGRAMLAVRDNELEAQAIGINVYKTKLAAFVVSGMIAGVGGSFLAVLLTNPAPTAFQSPLAEATSILLLTLVVIGGIDRSIGAFIGAVTLVVQQQVFAGADFFYVFVAVYSALVLILFLLFRPGGLVQVSKIQWWLIRNRPKLGIPLAVGIVALNVALAWLFLELS